MNVLDERPIVFEGAQGLQLDQDNTKYHPHLTPSRTGLKNVCSLLGDVGSPAFTAVYVTRSYITRHGAGPLPFEIRSDEFLSKYPSVKDETNLPNAWQGSLRFGPQIREYYDYAMQDLAYARNRDNIVKCEIAVTCLDQVDHPFLDSLEGLRYLSYGPATKDIKEI